MNIDSEVENIKDEIIQLRRDFHSYPELGFKEFRTAKIVAKFLVDCGLEVKEGIAHTGVTGILYGKKSGKTILLRADMDALPLQEETNMAYKSRHNGIMHACGHDGHTAMLLGAAKVLSNHKEDISGNIIFLFEPNEECAGAKMMIDEGVLDEPSVDAAFGIHLWSGLDSGTIGLSTGAVMAGLREFKLTITGKGGHTGTPHLSIDPIIAAAEVIQGVQKIQTREINPLKPTSIMFGKMTAGTSNNVIPGRAVLEGTIRYLYKVNSEEENPVIHFERIVKGICDTCRAHYKFETFHGNDVVFNDPSLTNCVIPVALSLVGNENITIFRCLGGDDFSEFSAKVPSVYCFVGSGNAEKETDYPHHNPLFNIDEDVLVTGTCLHVGTAMAFLS